MNKYKNCNGEGNFRVRPNGLVEYSVMLGFKHNGKPNRKSFYGHSRSDALEKYHAYLIAEAIQNKNTVLFSDFANKWYRNYEGSVQNTTYANYKYTLNNLIKRFGDIDISQIKEMDIEKYLKDEKKANRSDSVVKKERAMLYQILNSAVANDIIQKNPVLYVPKMKANGPVIEKDSFTEDEVKLLFDKLPDTFFGNMIRLMLATGIREQELLALEPRHLDIDNKTIRIEQAIKDINGHVEIGLPKTRDSIRTVNVPDFIIPVMIKLKQTNFKYISQRLPDKGPCTKNYFRKKFKELMNEVGVRELTPHCCRHTYVSQMQASGVSLDTIRSLVGHSDIDITEHYLHVQDNVKKDAVNKLNKLFSPAEKK